MDGNGCLDPSSTDFEQMIMVLRQRLRPTAAESLAQCWLCVYSDCVVPRTSSERAFLRMMKLHSFLAV